MLPQFTPQALFVVFAWIPVVLYFFSRFPAQRALIMSFVLGWLFLPLVTFPMPPFPPYTKMAATCYGILLATLIFDADRFTSFKPGWLDLPMLIWCLCPIASQVTTGGSPISPTFNQIVTWGIPYFLGRIYLNNLEGLRQLAVGIFAGGLAYIPFCLIENAKGPILHRMVYGFEVFNDWTQAKRYGGWRPVVFMTHGLMLGVWMMTGALIGIWLWRTGVLKKLWGISVKWLAIALTISFILCLSTGAYGYMVAGLLILFTAKWLRTALPLLVLICCLWIYMYQGTSGTFSSAQIIDTLTQVLPEERVDSLKFRFDNEEILGKQARKRVLFGWGDSGGNRIYDENGNDISTTDSLWIIVFGTNGIVGIISWLASLLLPPTAFTLFRYPASTWANRKVAPAAVLAVALVLYVLDCFLNAMINPVFALISGGISGLVLSEPATSPVKNVRASAPRRSLAQQRQNQPN